MNEIVVLEWNFSPPDYFEEPIQIKRDEYAMTINNGKVEARIDPTAYDKDHKMRGELQDVLNDYFLGVQLLTHKPYELSKASMYRSHPDGRKDTTIFLESLVISPSFGTIDTIVKDKEGNVASDSRQERIEKKKEIVNLVAKYRQREPLVGALLNSYQNSVKDPDNELVYLYEIRDALAEEFGRAAQDTLGISNKRWSRLGNLANNEPLRQGRHRGQKTQELRDATEKELEEARSIAYSLIESYLRYLKKQSII